MADDNNKINGANQEVAPMNQELPIKIIAEPKKFLFVSLESLSGDLAWHVKKEGHEVKAYIKAKSKKNVKTFLSPRIFPLL